MVPIDIECVNLCKAINKLPGLHTIESCCGHNEKPYNIWFVADDLKDLPALLYWFAWCHCGFVGWKVFVTTDCDMNPVHFKIEGQIGAFGEAEQIAVLIEEDIKKAKRPHSEGK